MAKPTKETPEECLTRRKVAFERGWVDSLVAHDKRVCQPIEDRYDYVRGWWACADYRWKDPTNRGIAPDPTYRPEWREW